MLGLGDFGLQQVNLLTNLLLQSILHDQILEVAVDEDLDQPPGLEPVPVDEAENDEVPNLEMGVDEVAFGPMIWTRMCDPLSLAQMALIHQREHMGAGPSMGQTLTNAVRKDAQWQEQFQASDRNVSETEADLDLTDLDESVGLFGLHSMEPCLVTAKSYSVATPTPTPTPTFSAR